MHYYNCFKTQFKSIKDKVTAKFKSLKNLYAYCILTWISLPAQYRVLWGTILAKSSELRIDSMCWSRAAILLDH